MVDTRPLMKGFGAAADVVGQIATDKAVSNRRVRSRFSKFDPTQGELLHNVTTSDSASPVPGTLQHSLGRVPYGAVVLHCADGLTVCTAVSSTGIVMDRNDTQMTVWVL